MSAVRFVYPKLDEFYHRRQMFGAHQLTIARECEDGQNWFGVRKAIENYCSEFHLKIEDVIWKIMVHPEDHDYAVIRAKDLDDWETQFKALKPVFEPIPER